MGKEKIYTIPVMDAYKEACDCPICCMYDKLERDKIDFLLDTAYMEDDIRSETNRLGFCEKHYAMINQESNRLGLALILQTHLKTIHNDILRKAKSNMGIKRNKKAQTLNQFIEENTNRCYICETVDVAFQLYLDTLFFLFKKDSDFEKLFKNTKGYCIKHFGILYDLAPTKLKGSDYTEFMSILLSVYENNVDTLQSDIDWFVRKFDYRFKDEPWNNAKTAIPKLLKQLSSLNLNR
jgi:hypothetical protein